MKIFQYKICLLGDYAVGKTCLIRRYVEGRFIDRYLSTIGVKVSRKSLFQNNTKFNLLIWDLADGEQFVRYQDSYLSGASGAIVVADLTRHATFEQVPVYVEQIRSAEPEACILLVGNKTDLIKEREVHDDEFFSASRQLRTSWSTASAKTGEQVEGLFQTVLESILARQKSHGS